MRAGKWIRALREERHITPTDVQRITRNFAEARSNSDFYVSHSTLADIESGAIPRVHKLFSLSLVLKVSLNELLLQFGIDPGNVTGSEAKSPIEPTSPPAPAPREPAFRFQLNFDANISTEETTLLKIRSQDIAVLPPPLRARFDPTKYRYASIGSTDGSMADLLPPRSLVEIDTSQKEIQVYEWQTLRERPIYFIWLSNGYTCCWCQTDGRELTLIPHPLSWYRIRRFKMPNEATVVGTVTNAWLPFHTNYVRRETAL